MMRRAALFLAVPVLALAVAGCDSVLDVEPPSQLTSTIAIEDANGARNALRGAYSALQSGSYYGGDLVFFGDLLADNTTHTGTFTSFAEADANTLLATNGSVEGLYESLYFGIGITNQILQRVPALDDLGETEKNEILGEAHFLRALHYHNLVKLWGPVPIVTTTLSSVEEASQVTRSPVDAVYAQVLSDLQEAERLITDADQTKQASLGAVKALLARVHLYRGEWTLAEQQADEVIAMGYRLADAYGDLFTPDAETPEAIFSLDFNTQDFNNFGYYFEVRREVRPTPDLYDAYENEDARRAWSIEQSSTGRLTGTKYPTTTGEEDLHVLRLGEVLLIRAEALARQGRLADAVDAYNALRVRAGLAPHVLGVDVSTPQDVLAAIWHERRLELAFEGDRWPDLVRTGRATDVLGIRECQVPFPIPQRELNVAPNLEQNPSC
ncbi:hypothetical protein BSZ37_19325 [Rubrivirga marina]|uniref:RagB/SusD family nutrient uptake outer membrane protein n=1 Tax=Rubrivirga marina TaxID=1196024 RepID=A0A271J4G7_9BACT|nr:hypothetical protein BSZ37_19325 [Rubrivirga marina]